MFVPSDVIKSLTNILNFDKRWIEGRRDQEKIEGSQSLTRTEQKLYLLSRDTLRISIQRESFGRVRALVRRVGLRKLQIAVCLLSYSLFDAHVRLHVVSTSLRYRSTRLTSSMRCTQLCDSCISRVSISYIRRRHTHTHKHRWDPRRNFILVRKYFQQDSLFDVWQLSFISKFELTKKKVTREN